MLNPQDLLQTDSTFRQLTASGSGRLNKDIENYVERDSYTGSMPMITPSKERIMVNSETRVPPVQSINKPLVATQRQSRSAHNLSLEMQNRKRNKTSSSNHNHSNEKMRDLKVLIIDRKVKLQYSVKISDHETIAEIITKIIQSYNSNIELTKKHRLKSRSIEDYELRLLDEDDFNDCDDDDDDIDFDFPAFDRKKTVLELGGSSNISCVAMNYIGYDIADVTWDTQEYSVTDLYDFDNTQCLLVIGRDRVMCFATRVPTPSSNTVSPHNTPATALPPKKKQRRQHIPSHISSLSSPRRSSAFEGKDRGSILPLFIYAFTLPQTSATSTPLLSPHSSLPPLQQSPVGTPTQPPSSNTKSPPPQLPLPPPSQHQSTIDMRWVNEGLVRRQRAFLIDKASRQRSSSLFSQRQKQASIDAMHPNPSPKYTPNPISSNISGGNLAAIDARIMDAAQASKPRHKKRKSSFFAFNIWEEFESQPSPHENENTKHPEVPNSFVASTHRKSKRRSSTRKKRKKRHSELEHFTAITIEQCQAVSVNKRDNLVFEILFVLVNNTQRPKAATKRGTAVSTSPQRSRHIKSDSTEESSDFHDSLSTGSGVGSVVSSSIHSDDSSGGSHGSDSQTISCESDDSNEMATSHGSDSESSFRSLPNSNPDMATYKSWASSIQSVHSPVHQQSGVATTPYLNFDASNRFDLWKRDDEVARQSMKQKLFATKATHNTHSDHSTNQSSSEVESDDSDFVVFNDYKPSYYIEEADRAKVAKAKSGASIDIGSPDSTEHNNDELKTDSLPQKGSSSLLSQKIRNRPTNGMYDTHTVRYRAMSTEDCCEIVRKISHLMCLEKIAIEKAVT